MWNKLLYAGAGMLMTATLAVAAPPAQAAVAQNGVCESGEFCLYYNSDRAGSLSDFTGNISDYGTYKFKSAGAGQGQLVKNNAASVRNLTFGTVTVFSSSSYGGSTQAVAPGAVVNLSNTLKNQNDSHRFGRTHLSKGLYRAYGGKISTPFDGYRYTAGRHEGIDIVKGIGAPVRALVAGKVINVNAGKRGRSCGCDVSLIAVYNSALDKTVIYLHSAPSVSIGETITKGQQIGVEDWRGVSTSSGTHTHVEMRLGAQKLAAVSVGTSPAALKLDNPDPTTFWNSQGYEER